MLSLLYIFQVFVGNPSDQIVLVFDRSPEVVNKSIETFFA